jgi:NADH dehydrogenase
MNIQEQFRDCSAEGGNIVNLVVGATGFLGTEICRRLAAEGKSVKALVRSTSDQTKVDKLKGYDVSLVQGDLRDHASLDAACQGVATVISTVSSMPFSYQPEENDIQTVDLEGVMNLVDAAQAAGVERFMYISFSGHIDLDFPLRNAKRAVEKRLQDGSLTYTILRPGYFMEVWLSPAVGFDVANAKAQVYGTGRNPISWISYHDVAQFAVESLDNPAARNAILELGGPEALSPLQVVKIFEEAGGRSFEVEHVPLETLEVQQKSATDPMQQSFSGLMQCYAQGDPIDMQDTLKAFPVQLTSVKAYAKGMLVST